MQESQALQTKQRQLQAALASAQKEGRAAAGQQERIAALEAEVTQAQASAAAAHEQLALAQSRGGVLEKAFAAASQVCALQSVCSGHARPFCPPACMQHAAPATAALQRTPTSPALRL